MEDDLWCKATFDGAPPLMEDNLWWNMTFDGRWPLSEDGLYGWRTNFGVQNDGFGPSFWGRLRLWGCLNVWCRIHSCGRWPPWKTTFDGRQPLMEDDLGWFTLLLWAFVLSCSFKIMPCRSSTSVETPDAKNWRRFQTKHAGEVMNIALESCRNSDQFWCKWLFCSLKTDWARQKKQRSCVALRERVTPTLAVVKTDAYKYSRHPYEYCQGGVVVCNLLRKWIKQIYAWSLRHCSPYCTKVSYIVPQQKLRYNIHEML